MIRLPKILLCILLPASATRLAAQVSDPAGVASLANDPVKKIAGVKSALPKLFSSKSLFSVGQVNLNLSSIYLVDTTAPGMGVMNTNGFYTDYTFNAAVSVANIPFNTNIQGSNNLYSIGNNGLNNLYRFNFNPREYLASIQKNVMAKIDPKVLINATMARLNAIKATYEKSLMNEINTIKSDLAKKYNTSIDVPAEFKNISTSDLSSLRNKLISKEQVDNYSRSTQVMQNAGDRSISSDSSLRSAQQDIQKYEALLKVYDKLIYWKKKFESDKTVNELRSHLSGNDMAAYLSDPSNLKNVVGGNFQLGALQSIFMNLTKFDAGQNGVASTGSFSTQNVINSGLNTQFLNKKIAFSAITGRNSSVNPLLQGGLRSAITNEYSNLSGFSFGSGSGSAIDQSVSVNVFSFRDNNATSSLVPSAARFDPVVDRKDIVVTIHTGLNIAAGHRLEVDLSKSVGQFAQSAPDSNKAAQALLPSLFNSEDGAGNYAASVDYKGEITGGYINLFVKKTGLGYNNPGNYLLRRGETQVGADVAKLFLKDKLNVKFKLKYKDQAFDLDRNSTNKSWEAKFAAAYKIDKNNKVGITYLSRDYNTALSNLPAINGVYSRFDLNGSYKIKYQKKTIINNTSIGWQATQLPLLTGQMYESHSTFFMHTSSLLLNGNILSLNVHGTKSDNDAYYFNNSQLNVESSYSYALLQSIRGTSSLGYYANTGWNKQVGVGQQFSATVWGKMNVDLQFNYKKAVEIIQNSFANQLYFTTAIRYHF